MEVPERRQGWGSKRGVKGVSSPRGDGSACVTEEAEGRGENPILTL